MSLRTWLVRAAVALAAIGSVDGAPQQDPTGPAAGRVAGRIVRPDGLPQPDAEVVLARRDRRGRLVQSRYRGRSTYDGRYEIRGVPPGRFQVLVRAIGADAGVDGRPHATLFPGVPITDPGATIDVLPGLSTEGIDVWMVPAPRRFQIGGRVFGPGGSTSFDTLAIEFGAPGTRATDVSTISDPGGIFSIDPAPPGTLVLRARATMGDRTFSGLVATTAVVGPVDDVRIDVREPVPVAGRLRALAGPLPAGLTVTLTSTVLRPSALFPDEEAAVRPDGAFALRAEPGEHAVIVRGLPPGWRVRLVGRARRDTVTIGDAAGTTLDVAVGPSATSLDAARPRRLR